MLVASSMILPVGMSYAQTYGGSMQPPSSSGNPTSTNQNMTMSSNSTNTNSTMVMTNSTSANSTVTMHDNATMTMHTNSTSTNSTMSMPQNTTPTNMTTSTPPTPKAPMSPLQQFKSGVSAKSVTCQSGYSLVIKAEDGSPACVHSSTVQILILRGWATAQ